MLLVPDHDLRDPDTTCLGESFDEQPVWLLAPLLWNEVIGLPKVDRVDLVEGDEVADVDGVGELDVQPIEILRLDRHVVPLLDFEGAHDVVRVNVLAGVLADLVVADRLEVAAVDEVEPQLARARGGQHPDRDADQPERDRPAPDRTRRHTTVVSAGRAPETACFPVFELYSYRSHNAYMAGISLWTVWTASAADA